MQKKKRWDAPAPLTYFRPFIYNVFRSTLTPCIRDLARHFETEAELSPYFTNFFFEKVVISKNGTFSALKLGMTEIRP
jgi:hypothetical protein